MAPHCQQCSEELQRVHVQFKKAACSVDMSALYVDGVLDHLDVGILLSYQLFTCKSVRLVCAAICLFSSSVGYGCWKKEQESSVSVFQCFSVISRLNRWRATPLLILPSHVKHMHYTFSLSASVADTS